jgi:hypothetical protein
VNGFASAIKVSGKERGRGDTYIIAVTFERGGELEVRHTYNLGR